MIGTDWKLVPHAQKLGGWARKIYTYAEKMEIPIEGVSVNDDRTITLIWDSHPRSGVYMDLSVSEGTGEIEVHWLDSLARRIACAPFTYRRWECSKKHLPARIIKEALRSIRRDLQGLWKRYGRVEDTWFNDYLDLWKEKDYSYYSLKGVLFSAAMCRCPKPDKIDLREDYRAWVEWNTPAGVIYLDTEGTGKWGRGKVPRIKFPGDSSYEEVNTSIGGCAEMGWQIRDFLDNPIPKVENRTFLEKLKGMLTGHAGHDVCPPGDFLEP